jgi:hypothetical protein
MYISFVIYYTIIGNARLLDYAVSTRAIFAILAANLIVLVLAYGIYIRKKIARTAYLVILIGAAILTWRANFSSGGMAIVQSVVILGIQLTSVYYAFKGDSSNWLNEPHN